jgi:hypothetical protein
MSFLPDRFTYKINKEKKWVWKIMLHK